MFSHNQEIENMENPLSKLALDSWYKVVIVVGAFVVLLNGAGLLPNYPTRETFIIGLGCVLFGVAEWMNHPMHEEEIPARYGMPALKRIHTGWTPCLIGVILDLFGIGLIIYGLVKLF